MILNQKYEISFPTNTEVIGFGKSKVSGKYLIIS